MIEIIIFHCNSLNILPFFYLVLVFSKNELSFQEVYKEALKMYMKYCREKKVLISIRDFIENPGIKLYFLIRGRKKRIVLQAFKYYLRLFNIREDYQLIDLSLYENSYFLLADIMAKAGLKQFSLFLAERACSKLYEYYREKEERPEIPFFKNR